MLLAATVDLNTYWKQFWTVLSGALPSGVLNLIAVIGAVMVFFAIIKWVLDMRKGGGGIRAHKLLAMTILVGVILAAPNTIMPLFFGIIDGAIGIVIALISKITSFSGL
jgi:hypothetical protein